MTWGGAACSKDEESGFRLLAVGGDWAVRGKQKVVEPSANRPRQGVRRPGPTDRIDV